MPAPPAKSRRLRGRPRLSEPNGTWIDSDVLARRVTTIVGTRDERFENTDALPRLRRLAQRLLGRPLSRDEREELRSLVVGKRAPCSVITRVLVGWRHGLGERDVRRMQHSLNVPQPDTAQSRPRVKLIYR
jgi:hypothetical protein